MINSKAIIKCFPGIASNDFILYIEPTLKNSENQFETVHMRINALQNRGSNIDFVTKSTMNVAKECKNYEGKSIFISGLIINNLRLDLNQFV